MAAPVTVPLGDASTARALKEGPSVDPAFGWLPTVIALVVPFVAFADNVGGR
jgi:hypothetical protein